MSYADIMNKMKENKTNGSEFCKTEEDLLLIQNSNVEIGHTHCEYCGKEIIAIWDIHNKDNYWPFLGTQARKPNVYKYSAIIQIMRKFYNVGNKIWDNNLLNVHARCHSSISSNPKRWCDQSVRLLCHNCFQKTYNRIKVKGDNGILYALSVVSERNETIESVMKDLNIEGEVLGKGSIIDYD